LVELPLWLNGHFHLHLYPTLRHLVWVYAPDLLHIDEEPYNLATFHAMLVARGAGIPALFVTWQNRYRCYPPPFAWLEGYNYRHAAYALAANEDAAAVLRRKGYQGPLAVFPQLGVDTDQFGTQPRVAHAWPRVGYVGRLVEQKGVDMLLRAFAPLAARAELIIVGRGPVEPALHRLSEELGIADRVRFVGSLGTTGVADLMAGLDILALPSRTTPAWAEQFGRVLVEAMASEVAVVGSTSGEIPRVIADAGLVFPEADVDALGASLTCLLDNPALRAELARKGRARALACYSQRHIADATYAAWRAALEDGASNTEGTEEAEGRGRSDGEPGGKPSEQGGGGDGRASARAAPDG
jgi:glycosyltransferase involved in cell wall biosynthesis